MRQNFLNKLFFISNVIDMNRLNVSGLQLVFIKIRGVKGAFSFINGSCNHMLEEVLINAFFNSQVP